MKAQSTLLIKRFVQSKTLVRKVERRNDFTDLTFHHSLDRAGFHLVGDKLVCIDTSQCA